jgi:hypothetical protein
MEHVIIPQRFKNNMKIPITYHPLEALVTEPKPNALRKLFIQKGIEFPNQAHNSTNHVH